MINVKDANDNWVCIFDDAIPEMSEPLQSAEKALDVADEALKHLAYMHRYLLSPESFEPTPPAQAVAILGEYVGKLNVRIDEALQMLRKARGGGK